MGNEFLDAIKDNDSDEDSSERFKKLKKEQAGTDQNEAEERFQELKEEAKKEFIEKQKRREEQEEEEEGDEDKFVTY